jgi:hypothetical protein
VAEAVTGGIEDSDIVGMQYRLYSRDVGMAAEGCHGMEYDRLAADRPVLLWPAGAGAKPSSGGNENGGGAFRFRHGTQRYG